MVGDILLLVTASLAFYLPGVAPRDYADGEPIDIKVNKLDSVTTQLPYDYYSLPFCRPTKVEEAAENLGEILSGDMIESSAYEISMKVPVNCAVLCKKDYTDAELAHFAERINEEYWVNWIVDNIPVATKYYTEDGVDKDNQPQYTTHYEKGFALGLLPSEVAGSPLDRVYINNHVRLVILYHEDPASFIGARVVGFEVQPFSVKHKVDGEFKGPGTDTKLSTCRVQGNGNPQPVSGAGLTAEDKTVIWTYDVEWQSSPIKWASRWDLYLKMTDSNVHWFSILNSIMIVLFLTGMVAMIMIRTLRRDFIKYNAEMTEEDREEETGWKLIHGDVFRGPDWGGFLAVLVGTGTQLLAMTVLTLIFAVLGFLSPANRGGLMTALLLLFVFMGMVGGYYSTRMYKMFKLVDWKLNTFATAVFFPGTVFVVFFVLNLFVWGEKSSGAVPFGTLVALLVLWFGISVPLVYLGSYFAFKAPTVEPAVKVNSIPRDIDLTGKPWYAQSNVAVVIGGVLPFGAVFIEIFFIMSSVWLHQFYYVFGVLFVVFLILIITCAEIAIVLCYFQLCNGDYKWWWRSFLTPGFSGVYLFLYSALYFATKLHITKFVSALLYFGYMFLASFAFFILTGTIGYIACHKFVSTIYSSIKIA